MEKTDKKIKKKKGNFICRHICEHDLGIIKMLPIVRKSGEQYGIHYKKDGCEGWCYELIYCKRKGCDYWRYGNGDYTIKKVYYSAGDYCGRRTKYMTICEKCRLRICYKCQGLSKKDIIGIESL